MSDGLQDSKSSQPTMHHIKRVEWDIEQWNQRIVPASHQDHGNEVRNRDGASTVSKRRQNLRARCTKTNAINAQDHIRYDDRNDEHRLETRGQRSHVDSGGEFELSIVTTSKERSVENHGFELSPSRRRYCKVSLGVVRQACDGTEVLNSKDCPSEDDKDACESGECQEVVARKLVVQELCGLFFSKLGSTELGLSSMLSQC